MQGVPDHFTDEKDSANFRHLAQVPGVELYHAHISRYAFEPHTHEAFGIGTIELGAERFRYRGSQYVASVNSIVTMNPDELHTGEAETADGWRYRMIYLDPTQLEEVTGVRHWWFSDVLRHDPQRSQRIGQQIFSCGIPANHWLNKVSCTISSIPSAPSPIMRRRVRKPAIASTRFATICTITTCSP